MGRTQKIKIIPTFSINRVQALKDRNRQLEQEISDLIREKNKIDILIETDRNEIKENCVRINKLQRSIYGNTNPNI
jgi:hypothetical protein